MAEEIALSEGSGFLEARYLGTFSLAVYKRQMSLSVQACKERKLDRLLVDISDLVNFSPTTTDRYELGQYGSTIGRGMRVAVLGSPAQLQDAFASQVARNRGVTIQAFIDRKTALEWLLMPDA